MRSLSLHKRLLPLTMTVMVLLFAEKAVSLVREATAKEPQQVAATTSSIVQPDPLAGLATPSLPELPRQAPAPPVVSASERQLLQDLRRRSSALDNRERQLDQRADLVQAAELKLQDKLAELTALQAHLEQVEDARRRRASGNWDGLVKTYQDMKPHDAAAIFDVLDLNVLLEVLDRMDERKAAAVLAAMVPERARLATQMLAQKRLRADAIDPSGSGAQVVAVGEHHG